MGVDTARQAYRHTGNCIALPVVITPSDSPAWFMVHQRHTRNDLTRKNGSKKSCLSRALSGFPSGPSRQCLSAISDVFRRRFLFSPLREGEGTRVRFLMSRLLSSHVFFRGFVCCVRLRAGGLLFAKLVHIHIRRATYEADLVTTFRL